MFKRQSSAARVTPAWSFAQWPLKRKLFAALVFPVGLSFVLGGVAVQSDFQQAGQLANAADTTLQVRPVVEYNLAVQALAAAESVGGGGVISAITKYESAAANLRIALKSGAVSDKVRADAENALSLGNAVRAAKTQQSFAATVIEKSANTASVLSTMVGDLALSDDADSAKMVVGLQDTLASQRAMVGQQLNLGNTADASAGMSALKQVGAEASFLTRLRDQTGQANVADVRQLINENDRRGLSLGGALDEATITELAAGYERSNAAYRSMIERQLTDLETTLRNRADGHRQQAVINALLILVALLAALLIVIRLLRSLLTPIRAVRQGALDIARQKLPEAVARIRDGQEPEKALPIPVHTTEEMGQLARAVDDLHTQALSLAGEQARLRVQVNSMFETLSRRSTSLVDQQLSLIERLERDEQDPKRLQSLFKLDHLAARMRRNSDSLLVLAGTSTRRGLSGSVSIADVVRAAVSEVENYERIDIGETSDDHVLGSVGSDLIHLLAELIDNALAYSPPTSRVSLRGARTSHGGLLVEVADRGLGMPPEELAALNERLATGGDVTADTARRMGLFVVGNLAQRHGVLVRLRRNADQERGGITVSVQLPAALLESRGGSAAAPTAAAAAAATSPVAETTPTPASPLNGHSQPARGVAVNGRAAPATAPAARLEPMVFPSQQTPSAGQPTTSGLPKRVPGKHGPTQPESAKAELAKAEPATAEPTKAGLPKRVPGQHGPVQSAAPQQESATAEPTKAGLPKRVPGQHGPQPEPATAEPTKAGLPKRVPGQQLPGAEQAQADLPAPLTADEQPAAKSGRQGLQRRIPGLFHSLRGGSNGTMSTTAPEAASKAAATDAPRPGSSGLPVRKPNATRITELTGGPVTRPEGAETDTTPRMPANLSAWLDHRAALAAAREAREAREAAEAGPAGAQAPDVSPEVAAGAGQDAIATDAASAPVEPSADVDPDPVVVSTPLGATLNDDATSDEVSAKQSLVPDEDGVELQASDPELHPVDAEPAEPPMARVVEHLTLPESPDATASDDVSHVEAPLDTVPVEETPDAPATSVGLPRRRPGASGIDTSLVALGEPVAAASVEQPADEPAEVESAVVTEESDAATHVDETASREAAAATASAAPEEAAASPGVTTGPLLESARPRLPVRTPGASGAGLEQHQAAPASSPPHRSQATAFLGARRAEPAPGSRIEDTPIFRSMMSNWLTDSADSGAAGWSPDAADEGWSAAARVDAAEPLEESAAGLPIRRPGDYLVPGAIEHPEHERATPVARKRDPEAIRRNLNRHHNGVSSARAEALDAPHSREEADVHH